MDLSLLSLRCSPQLRILGHVTEPVDHEARVASEVVSELNAEAHGATAFSARPLPTPCALRQPASESDLSKSLTRAFSTDSGIGGFPVGRAWLRPLLHHRLRVSHMIARFTII